MGGGVSPVQAVERAREYVTRAGMSWVGPVMVDGGISTYRIRTNIMSLGGNIYAFVRRRDGSIVDVGVPTRNGWKKIDG
jgi:hypothetical protein